MRSTTRRRHQLLWPGVVFGIGLAGTLDEVILHQLLRWCAQSAQLSRRCPWSSPTEESGSRAKPEPGRLATRAHRVCPCRRARVGLR